MIEKILWATDGSKDPAESLKYVEVLAKKFKASVLSLLVLPDYFGMIENFSTEDKNRFTEWIEESVKAKEEKKLQDIQRDLSKKGIVFKIEIGTGIPYKEILRVASENNVNLIALGKGRAGKKSILGGTALKVIRKSSIPVLTSRENTNGRDINRILVPIDQSHGISNEFNYAVELSKKFRSFIYLLNVVEVGEHKFPPEIIEQMKGFCYRELKENVGKVKISENLEPCVESAKNAWSGIVKFANDKDIDLIVMMTYGGGKVKEEFIGSVTQKVIQEANCPVVTFKP